MSVPACVLTVPGTNCHRETADALEAAGAMPEIVHYNQLADGSRRLAEYAICAFPGGFADGDHIAAGRLLGMRLRTELAEEVTGYLAAGKAIVGICNGFQALIESGLLPGGVIDGTDRRSAALAPNKEGGFHCDWKDLEVVDSVCRFVSPDIMGRTIELQVAHGEGQFKMRERSDYHSLATNRQVVFRYCDSRGVTTEEFPDNPNGSPFGITGICDPSGQVLGMMPHPERSIDERRFHPPYGLELFKQLVNYARQI